MNNSRDITLDLVKKLYRGCSKFEIQLEDLKCMTWTWQEEFLDVTYKRDFIKKYPINRELSRLFLKRLINFIEPVHEVHDGLYSELCEAMKCNVSNEYCYRHYVIGNDFSNVITMKETNNMVVNGTTGMRTWEAALMLSDWILQNKELFTSKDVLELGSGIGFTGITLAKFCQPHTVLLSDCHQDVLNVLCENVEINFPRFCKIEQQYFIKYKQDSMCEVDVMMLDWNEIADLPDSIRPEIILGADIIYDPSILEPLCNTLKLLYRRQNNVEIYIACIIRNQLTFESFLQVLETNNFKYLKMSPHTSMHIDWDHSNSHRCLLKIVR